MYEFHNNILCVQGGWLVESGILKLSNYKQLISRGFLNLLRRGGNGRTALIEFSTMREDIRKRVVELAGDPKVQGPKEKLERLIITDNAAAAYFSTYRKSNGRPLSLEKQKEYRTNAEILNAIDAWIIDSLSKTHRLSGRKIRIWEKISNAVNTLPSNEYQHSLPGNYRRLMTVYKKYKSEDYAGLVHGGTGNENTKKITGEIADFILATYCLPNKPLITHVLAQYDQVRLAKGWPSITARAIEMYLEQPEVKRLWTLSRHGLAEYRNQYMHKISRDRSEWFPNAYWAIDGTKLDWVYYYDEQSDMVAKLRINPVFDVHSEMIIGYSLSETENHTDHFTALKSAVNFTGCRPFLLTYDGQAGHKSKRMQELYTNLVARNGGTHYKHAARQHGSPVEQLFSRLQQQVISTFWFSDKQGVRTRDLDSRPNPEFLLQQKHMLLSKDQMIKAWEYAMSVWNNAKHPHLDMSRSEVFAQQSPIREEFDFMDMISTFWVNESDPIKYYADGLKITVAREQHHYEVYDAAGNIDLEFRRLNIGKRFIVRYDPEAMTDYVQLLERTPEGDLLFVANAQPKREHQVIPVLMKEGDKSIFTQDFAVRDQELKRDMRELVALQERTGITPDRLIKEQNLMIKLGGQIPKRIQTAAEHDSALYDL